MSMDYPKISLRAARINADLGQKEAAKRLGISVSTLQSYEKGVTAPDIVTAKKMESVYGFPFDYIFFAKSTA